MSLLYRDEPPEAVGARERAHVRFSVGPDRRQTSASLHSLRRGPRPRSDRDHFHVRLDLLHQALDPRERARYGARAAPARALVVDHELVALQADDVEIAAVALQVRPHLLVED